VESVGNGEHRALLELDADGALDQSIGSKGLDNYTLVLWSNKPP